MQITIPGFPRIGKNRELKFITEKFFKKEINEKVYLNEIKKINQENISIMKKYLDLIPANDFSLYDNILDLMWALGVVEKKYLDNKLSYLEKYFAIARGIKEKNIDLLPYDMKKWFNTNYHFIVPKINNDLSLKTDFFFLEKNINTAKEIINDFKVVLIGPYTFIKLAKMEKENQKINERIIQNYIKLLKRIIELKVKNIQLDEPSICLDSNKRDINLFKNIYSEVLKEKKDSKIFIQTYFSCIDEKFIPQINKLNIDGLGLDFIEGKENLKFVKRLDLNNKFLIAGVVNGKNIWINNYKNSIEILRLILKNVKKENIMLSTHSSLLFVPYTKRNETKIPNEMLKFLSFAEEKMQELKDLKNLLQENNLSQNKIYQNNQKIIDSLIKLTQLELKQNFVLSFKIKDLNRKSNIAKRKKIQEKFLKLPILPTTTIGSFPQTVDVRIKRKDFKEGKITHEQYKNFIKEKINDLIKFQEEIKLDILVHGEFERNDMVEYFAENLQGFIITNNGWVQSYGTRTTKPPIIFSCVKRKYPITVEYITYAQSLTQKPVKAILTGPITIINWSFPNEFLKIKSIAFSIAQALREEINDLVKNGIKIIQVDEPALREKLPLKKQKQKEYLDIAINAFKYCVKDVPDEIQIHTHMCYSEFKDIINCIEKMDVDVISIEASRSDFSILKHLKNYAKKRQIGPGIYDVHSTRVPDVNELIEKIKILMKIIDYKNLWINPDCGLKTRNWDETKQSLKNMVEAKENILKSKNYFK
ncbi:MAG: 5-methyltetrahydropteroyltriglutamate--homocysteine S-methyltransferase [Patescibacteria group bacterium]|nr:5-methyltetrahydropteroyltriglutamate--homocysteine S-methyltransferase [Patescibacteria group bacterium]